jgi:hypothetical protein
MALGRISGPLLKSNLLRNGVDLAFETNLLYLDVTNRRIGINTGTPSHDLQVNGTARVTTLNVSGSSTLGNITFGTNSINSATNQITMSAGGSNPVVYQGILQVGQLQLTANTLSTLTTNQNINLTTTGTGAVIVNNNLTVTGNLYTQGNLTVDGTVTIKGNITIGDQTTDTVAITAGISSDLIPATTATYNLGSSSGPLYWNNIYATTSYYDTINVTSFQTNNLVFSSNTITDTVNNADIQFATTGVGGIIIGNIKVNANNITNTVSNAVTTFNQTTGTASFTGSVAVATAITFTGSVSGSTLTVTTVPTGAGIVVGQSVSGGTIPTGTYIVGNLSGTGTSASSTWALNNYLTQASTTVTAQLATLTVTAVTASPINSGMVLSGSGVTTNTVIISQNTATTSAIASPTFSSGGAPSAYTFVVSSASGIVKGQFVSGTGIPNNTFVSIVSGTSITLTKAFTIQAAGTYNFYTPGTQGTYYVSPAQTVSSTTISGTVTGYVYIGGTNGVVIPAGTTAQRPGTPTTGMIRFNTDSASQAVEVYTGSQWAGVAGVSAGITINQATDTAAQWALALG